MPWAVMPLRNPEWNGSEISSLLTQMVCIGTVADLVPLNEIYNRVIVKHGLSEYKRNPHVGVKH